MEFRFLVRKHERKIDRSKNLKVTKSYKTNIRNYSSFTFTLSSPWMRGHLEKSKPYTRYSAILLRNPTELNPGKVTTASP